MGKPEETIGILGRRWEDDIKMVLTAWEGVD